MYLTNTKILIYPHFCQKNTKLFSKSASSNTEGGNDMIAEIELIKRTLDGETEAFGQLVLQYQKLIYRLAYRILGNSTDAQDVVQEVFTKAYQNLSQLKKPKKFRSWLMKIANNECYSWIRKRQENLFSLQQEMIEEDTLHFPPAPDELVIRKELYNRAMSAIAELPESERTTAELFYLEEKSYQEIQEELGISKSLLGWRLSQARAKLRRKLRSARLGIAPFLSNGFNRVGTMKQTVTNSVIALSTAKYLLISLFIHLTLFTTAPLFDGRVGHPFQHGSEYSEPTSVAVALLSTADASDWLSLPSSPSATLVKYSSGESAKSPSSLGMRDKITALPVPELVEISGLDAKAKMQSTLPREAMLFGYANSPELPSGDNVIPVIPAHVSIQSVSSRTGRSRFSQGFHGQTNLPVAFDVNAQTVVSSNNGISAEIPPAEEPVLVLRGHQKRVTKISFSPDGGLLASLSRDKTICLWDVATGRGNILLGAVYSFDFSPDGKWLATSSYWEEHILLRDISGRETIEIPACKRINDLCFSQDGKLLVATAYTKTFCWDMTNQREIFPFKMRNLPSNYYFTIAFSPDDEFLAWGTMFGGIELWSLTEGRLVKRLFGGTLAPFCIGQINSIQFSPDGRLLAASGGSGNVALWDVNSGQMKRVFADVNSSTDVNRNLFNPGQQGVVFNPNGMLLATGSLPVELRDTATGRVVQRFRGAQPVAFTPDGGLIAVQGQNNDILLWTIDFLEQEAFYEDVATDKIAFVSDRDAGRKFKNAIYLMEADGSWQDKLANPPEKRKSVGGLSVSPDGKKIAFHAVDASGNSDIWTMTADGENQKRLRTSSRNASNPAWSPDGSKIAFEFGTTPRTDIYVMNADGTNRVNLTNNGADNQEPSWSPDGKEIIFSAKKKRARVRNIRNLYIIHLEKKRIFRLTKNSKRNQQSRQPAWSPDGKYIAYIYDGGLFIMDADGKNPRKLVSGGIMRPVWSPDGTEIAFAARGEIYVVAVDGRSLTKLTHNKQKDGEPSWLVP